MAGVKSIRLYGKPNKEKAKALLHMQTLYTDSVNAFISALWDEDSLWADIFQCNPHSSVIRAFEKARRNKTLGCALSQAAMDEAVEKLAEVFSRSRMEMFRFLSKEEDEYYFVLSKLLFKASLASDGFDETRKTLVELMDKSKKDEDKQKFYKDCLDKMDALGEKKTLEVMSAVKFWFTKTKNDRNIPHVGRAWVRADSRAQNFGKSTEGIVAPYVAEITTEVGGKRTVVPLTTSSDSLRRLNQYKPASTIMYSVKPNGKLIVQVAVSKQVKNKSKKNVFVGADVGITDVIAASDGRFYGSLLPAQAFYDDTVLLHLGRLQALRNLMRTTRMELRQTSAKETKAALRAKICHINTMIQQNKVVGRSLNRYDAIVDKEISDVVKAFVADRLEDLATSVFEALDIRTFNRGKKSNRRDSMWSRGKLLKRLQEELAWHGLSFVEVEPSYTSQVCPICGHLEKANRDGKTFKCLHCGHEDDADHNASINIALRVTDSELKKLLAKPSTLRERQAALRKWYSDKELEYDRQNNITESTA